MVEDHAPYGAEEGLEQHEEEHADGERGERELGFREDDLVDEIAVVERAQDPEGDEEQ